MVNANIYMHDSDRAALQALKAIPGFTQLLKAYMKVWNERQFRVANMSGKLRISEKQMPKYYDMLPPICEKLGIKVPELYLELDVEPNSYTYGYTKPFIVLTSGMLETVPDELIPTILAHECGHIACRHTMFTTMGNMILNGMVLSGGVAALATTPVKVAFAYWMRCSEFSADRAAMICDGSPDKMMEVCMRLAGYDKDIIADASMDAFLEQADEYREMVKTNKWDKTMEFIQYYQNDHPLTAVRAYECRKWSKSETFKKIIRYNLSDDDVLPDNDSLPREIPMDEPSKYYVGKNYEEVMDLLIDAGFTSIETVRSTDKGFFTKSGQIKGITDFQDAEFKSRVITLIDQIEKVSEFQMEVMENEELRDKELDRLYQMEETCIQLLNQAGLLIESTAEKTAKDYKEYEQEVYKVQRWYLCQKILIEALGEIVRLKYVLHNGNASREYCMGDYAGCVENVRSSRERLTEWHEKCMEEFDIDMDEVYEQDVELYFKDGRLYYLAG